MPTSSLVTHSFITHHCFITCHLFVAHFVARFSQSPSPRGHPRRLGIIQTHPAYEVIFVGCVPPRVVKVVGNASVTRRSPTRLDPETQSMRLTSWAGWLCNSSTRSIFVGNASLAGGFATGYWNNGTWMQCDCTHGTIVSPGFGPIPALH